MKSFAVKLQYLLIITLLLFIVSCKEKKVIKEKLIQKTVETYDDGTKKSVDYYSEEQPDKCVKEEGYYPNGKLRYRLSVKDGKKNGQCLYYYESGKLWTDQNYENDAKEGMSVVYNENGSKKIEGSYKNDKPDGKWLFYDNEGKLTTTVIYENGEIKSQN